MSLISPAGLLRRPILYLKPLHQAVAAGAVEAAVLLPAPVPVPVLVVLALVLAADDK